jgi:hypothetical protein
MKMNRKEHREPKEMRHFVLSVAKFKYIQPLGAGTFDVGAFMKTLSKLGYTGPVGLQCYSIGGDARDHLIRSMAAWRKLNDPANRGGVKHGK